MSGWILLHQPLLTKIRVLALKMAFVSVVGTTGFTSEEIAELKAFSREQDLGGLIALTLPWGVSCLCNLRRRLPNISQCGDYRAPS